jgi:hypothetical protein
VIDTIICVAPAAIETDLQLFREQMHVGLLENRRVLARDLVRFQTVARGLPPTQARLDLDIVGKLPVNRSENNEPSAVAAVHEARSRLVVYRLANSVHLAGIVSLPNGNFRVAVV